MSDLRREQIELHISKFIPTSLGINKSVDGTVDEEKRISVLKSMVALACFNDKDFIFSGFYQGLKQFKEDANEILKKVDKLLADDALLGIKTNSISGITDYSDLIGALEEISNNIQSEGEYGGAEADNKLQDFLDNQLQPQISNAKKETILPLIKNLFSSFYSLYEDFQNQVPNFFNSIENYEESDLKSVLSESVLRNIESELVTILIELNSNIPEEEQGEYIEETAVIVATVKNILTSILGDPVNPIGAKIFGPVSTGSTGQKASFIYGKATSKPPEFLYKAPFNFFVDYAMAENNASTPSSTVKRGLYPLTPANNASNFDLSSVSNSDFLEIEVDGTILKLTKATLGLTNTVNAQTVANAIQNQTGLLTTPTTDGNTAYIRTTSELGSSSKISILSTSSSSFTNALGVSTDKIYKGRLTVNLINTTNVNSHLNSQNTYWIYILGEGSFEVDSFTNSSITIKGQITADRTGVPFIVTNKRLGTLVFPTSTLTTPISEEHPAGRTLSSLWRSETGGNYEVPYIDSGSTGSLVKEVALFGKMSNYIYESTTGVINPIKSTGTTGFTRKPKYSADTGKLGIRASSLPGGRVVTGAVIGKPATTPNSSNITGIYLPTSQNHNTYILSSAIAGSSDPNYVDEDFVATIGSFIRLGDYVEISDSGSSYNPQTTSTKKFEGATFRVKKFGSTYAAHSSGFPAILVLPDYDKIGKSPYSTYNHFEDSGFANNNFYDQSSTANFLKYHPHAELEIDVIQMHRFQISSGDFDDVDIAHGDYLVVHPNGGSYIPSNWSNATTEVSYSNFYEIHSKDGRRDLILNTGWLNSLGGELTNSVTSFSSPYYNTGDSIDGLFAHNTTTSDLWQDRDPSTGHRFFIFKKGRLTYDADGTDIFIDDAYYSFSDTSGTFVNDGVSEGDLFSITAVGNADPYNAYGSTFETSTINGLTGISNHTIGMVESNTQMYAYGSTDSVGKSGYGKFGFRYTASNLTYEVRDPRYRKIIQDANATFITDGVTAGMFVRMYERNSSTVTLSFTVDEVLSETQILVTSETFPQNADQVSAKFYISTNSEVSQNGNVTSIVKLNIHEDYDFDVFSAGVVEDDYTIFYLDTDGVSTQLRSLNIFEVKDNGYIQINASNSGGVTNTHLPAFYNTPFCIIENKNTTSLFQQSTDLTSYTDFPLSSEIESEERPLTLRLMGDRESIIAGIGGINQYSDDDYIINLAGQVATNVTVNSLTTSPEALAGKPTFSGSDTNVTFGLAAGTTIKNFYGNFTSSDSEAEIVWRPGDASETRHSVKNAYTGYVTLSEEVSTITTPDTSFTDISGRNTLPVPYYAVIPDGYPTSGNEIVYGNFRSKIKQVMEARTRRYSSPSDTNEFKTVYELENPYPMELDISNDAYVVSKGANPRSFVLVASEINDQDGNSLDRGFLNAPLDGASLSLFGNAPFSTTVKKAKGRNRVEVTEELPQIIEDTEFSIDLGFFGTIAKLESGQTQNAISVLNSDHNISIWEDLQKYSVSSIPSSASINISPNTIADRSNLTYVAWKGGSNYYGQYLILKSLVDALDFSQDIEVLSRYLNEVIASYGADKVLVNSYGNIAGTTKIAEFTETSILKTSSFANVVVGDKITLVIYSDGSHRTIETYIKEATSSDEIKVYESLEREIVYIKIERSAVSYSLNIIQSIKSNLDKFVEYVDAFPRIDSQSFTATADLLNKEGLDNGLDVLTKEGLSSFLNLHFRDFSNEGKLSKSIEELGSSLYKE